MKFFGNFLNEAFDDVDEVLTTVLAVVIHFLEKPFIYIPVLPRSWVRLVVCVVVSRHVVARVR